MSFRPRIQFFTLTALALSLPSCHTKQKPRGVPTSNSGKEVITLANATQDSYSDYASADYSGGYQANREPSVSLPESRSYASPEYRPTAESSSNYDAPEVLKSATVRTVSSAESKRLRSIHSAPGSQRSEYSSDTLLSDDSHQKDAIKVGLVGNLEAVFVEIANGARTIDADGRDIIVVGSTSKISIRGKCRRLLLNGSFNVVVAGDVQDIEIVGDSNNLSFGDVQSGLIHGSNNRVDWTRKGPRPNLKSNGQNNSIAQ